jgi:large subunit ribosomal protein L21
MNMYAIVDIGGKQYRLEKDMTINVDKVSAAVSGTLTIDKVLMCVDGEKVLIGKPYLSNVKVSASVLKELKGPKVRGIKFKKRKNYTRTLGFRPRYLQLKIQDVTIQ